MFGNNSEFSCLMLMGFLSIAEYNIPDIIIVSFKSYQDLDPASNNICFWNQAWICFRPAQSKVQLGCVVFLQYLLQGQNLLISGMWWCHVQGSISDFQVSGFRLEGLAANVQGLVSDFQVWGLRSEGLPSFPGGVTVGHLKASVSLNHF